jgi:gluconate 2-dehydrogenase gamma chain
MAKDPDLNRRRLILGLAPTAALTALAATGCGTRQQASSQASYAPTFFSQSEWAFITAAVARIIPAEGEGPGGLEAGVAEFIDRQMELPYGYGAYFYLKGPFLEGASPALGYQLRFTPRETYRLGIAAANAATSTIHHQEFAKLSPADQDAFLTRMERNQVQFPQVPAPVFFGQLLANSKEGYFADPLYGGNRDMVAWKWIGFPGARADFTDWLDQAGRNYPYGPVSINGARG